MLTSAGQGKHAKAGAYQGREAERAEGRGQEVVLRPPCTCVCGEISPLPLKSLPCAPLIVGFP